MSHGDEHAVGDMAGRGDDVRSRVRMAYSYEGGNDVKSGGRFERLLCRDPSGVSGRGPRGFSRCSSRLRDEEEEEVEVMVDSDEDEDHVERASSKSLDEYDDVREYDGSDP